ncbi:glycoside hydrolase 5 family protein [Lacisediminihabitans changchengi]|uniref:Glycosyl hydrolase n=1 Tax=Lacisediminihabitans changchengi TaxID=2787634 RepID=A0A934SIM7_9MICO|nr:glycosyl hydrolase [Lacisediminihabitans changchengi]MBK4346288.1 glycosyl hydrolase [Lacisediminihabitans changchengi]
MSVSLTRSRPLRWGANYTPRDGWFHSWLDFDADAVRRDFEVLAGLGLDHVRVFPIWPLLQPSRTLIRGAELAKVGTVVDVAAEFGMDVAVDGLQGHLSSFDFLPSWVTSWHRRNIFTDPQVVAAEAELITAIAREVSARPNVIGLTVGNETDQFALDRHPEAFVTSADQMGAWLETMLAAAREGWPHGQHQHSFDDDVWFDDRSPVTPLHAAALGDVTTVHSWIFTAVAREFPAGHPARTRFAEYLVQLAAAWSDDPQRPVWLQEIGAPFPAVAEADAPDFLESSLRNTLDSPQLWGVTWWCSHDVSRTLGDFPELEYTLGLIDSDGVVKPIGRRLAELIQSERANPTAPVERTSTIEFDAGDPFTAPSRSATRPGGTVFASWLEAVESGERVGLSQAIRE